MKGFSSFLTIILETYIDKSTAIEIVVINVSFVCVVWVLDHVGISPVLHYVCQELDTSAKSLLNYL